MTSLGLCPAQANLRDYENVPGYDHGQNRFSWLPLVTLHDGGNGDGRDHAKAERPRAQEYRAFCGVPLPLPVCRRIQRRVLVYERRTVSATVRPCGTKAALADTSYTGGVDLAAA